MGVRLNRSILIARGKNDEATEFAAEVCAAFEKATGVPLVWGLEIGGTVGVVHWFAEYENLAALEASFLVASADESYQKLLDTAVDFFDGPPQDTWVYIR